MAKLNLNDYDLITTNKTQPLNMDDYEIVEPKNNTSASSTQYVANGMSNVSGMIKQGNIDLLHRPVIKNPDGSISTVYSMTFTNDDGSALLLPGVRPGLNRKMTPQEALDWYKKTGQNLGTFKTEADADKYADTLHDSQDQLYSQHKPSGASGSWQSPSIIQQIEHIPGAAVRGIVGGVGDIGTGISQLGVNAQNQLNKIPGYTAVANTIKSNPFLKGIIDTVAQQNPVTKAAEDIAIGNNQQNRDAFEKVSQSQQNAMKNSGGIEKTAFNIGRGLPLMGAAALSGPAAPVVFGGVSAGNAMREAEQEGATPEQQNIHAGIIGVVNGLTSIPVLGNLNKVFTAPVKRALANYLLSIPEAGAQAVISDIANGLSKQFVYKPDEFMTNGKIDWDKVKNAGIDAAKSGGLSAGSAAILGGIPIVAKGLISNINHPMEEVQSKKLSSIQPEQNIKATPQQDNSNIPESYPSGLVQIAKNMQRWKNQGDQQNRSWVDVMNDEIQNPSRNISPNVETPIKGEENIGKSNTVQTQGEAEGIGNASNGRLAQSYEPNDLRGEIGPGNNGENSKTLTINENQAKPSQNNETVFSSPLLSKAKFNNPEEAQVAFDAKRNGVDWFKKEFSDIDKPDQVYKELTNKVNSLTPAEQNQFHIDLQQFAMKEPNFKKTVKDKFVSDRLISRARTNTFQRATGIPDDVKEEMGIDRYGYEKESAKEWQSKAENNIKNDRDEVVQKLSNAESISGGAQSHEAAILTHEMSKEAHQTKDYSEINKFTAMLAPKIRETGRALKGWDTAFDKASPEGALITAQKVVNRTQEEIENNNPQKAERIKSETKRVKEGINQARKEAAKKTAEEMLADRVINTIQVKQKAQPDPIKGMVNELYKVAKESPLPIKKPTTTDPYEFLREAVQNKEQYSAVWGKAKKIIAEKYGNNPNVMKALDNYLKKDIVPSYSETTFNKSMDTAMKDLEQKLTDIAKSPSADRDKALADLADYLVGQTGATKEEASIMAQKTLVRFDGLVKERAGTILRGLFKELPPSEKPNTLKSIQELSNLGAFRNDLYKTKVAEKLEPKVKTLLSKSNINLGELVKKSVSDVNFTWDMFLLNLQTKLKINKEDAAEVLNETEKIFNDLVKAKKQSTLKNMFKAREPVQPKSLTEKVIQLINLGAYNDANIVKLIREKEKLPVLTDADAKVIMETMDRANKLPDNSYAKRAEIAKVTKLIANKVPPTLGEKISSFQTIAQLLNPKTNIRNILGNVVFYGPEKVSETLGAGMDKLISIYTKKQTHLLPDVPAELKGFFRAAKEAKDDFKQGINTSPSMTQFELPRKQVFKGKILGTAEKLTSASLQAGDRPFYQAAYDGALSEQMRLANVKEPTKEMMDQAKAVAQYRTFQDDSAVASLFSRLKNSLNFKSGPLKGTGFGDLILKYPKTPGNLLARAIDYSPAGYLNSLNQLRGAFKGEFNQRAFVDSLSRATVGTGMFLAGITLYNLGIVSGRESTDKDVNNLQQATGLGQYKINLSALRRFTTTFDSKSAQLRPGDKFMSYDWIQPSAVSTSMGVNLAQQLKEKNRIKALDAIGAVVAGLEGGVGTLAEQPLVQGVANLFKGFGSSNIVDSLIQTAASAPASFIPTLSNQIKQITDNTRRNIQSDNPVQTSANLVKNKIPGLSKTLPERYTTLGQKQATYQNNSLFNVLFNPSYSSEYKANPAAKLVMDIYNRTGSKDQFPRVAPKYVTANQKKIELTPQEQAKLQQYMGQMVSDEFGELAKNSYFLSQSDDDKIKQMKKILDQTSAEAKKKLLQEKGITIKSRSSLFGGW